MSGSNVRETQTPRLNLNLPDVGGDWDQWGDETNANWQYVDTNLVPVFGCQMTGQLLLFGPPTVPTGAASKAYVDSLVGIARVTVADVAPALTAGALWWDSVGLQLYIGFDDGTSLQWVAVINQPGDAAMYGVTKNDRSGTITIGNLAQPLMAANPARRGWSLQNKSTAYMWFNDLGGTADPNANNSTYLTPGAYYESEPDGASVTSISIYGTATGAQFVAKEW